MLGSETNTAYVYSRDGRERGPQLKASGIEWTRLLSEVSRSTLSVPASRCTPEVTKVRALAHSLVIFRGRDRVWEGPIRKVQHTPIGLSIAASDVLGLLDRRPIRTPRKVAASPVVTEARQIITAAFSTDDPNVLTWLEQRGPNGPNVSREVARFTAYAADELGTLVGQGLRYTVLGRRIVVWADSHTVATLPTLVPEQHLQADVTVTDDGDLLATEAVARDDNGAWQAFPTAATPDAFYGQVTQLVPVTGQQKAATLLQAAKSARAQGYPGQYVIEVPSDALMRCDAPFAIGDLAPGVQLPLETTTATGLRLSGTFILAGVKVNQAAKEDEKVSVTVAPLTTAAVA